MPKNRVSTFLFVIGALILFGIGFAAMGAEKEGSKDPLSEMGQKVTTLNLSVPVDLNFAGEMAPATDFDVKERFENQLVRNVFFHSSTIMTLKRAQRWEKEIMSILKAEGVPEDFFYLCVAESHLVNATSYMGAKGFWQFLAATAKEKGLEVSGQVDERYDPIKSTYAACKYIKSSYKKFGNWTLVAASYNMGVRGVEKALERQKVDSYYELFLNAETSAYVFRILALKSILLNPEKYGFVLDDSELYYPIPYKNVQITSSLSDLVAFAQENEISYRDLKVMNPWLRSDRLDVFIGNNKGYEVKIPLSKVYDDGTIYEEDSRFDSDSSRVDSIGRASIISTKDSILSPVKHSDSTVTKELPDQK